MAHESNGVRAGEDLLGRMDDVRSEEAVPGDVSGGIGDRPSRGRKGKTGGGGSPGVRSGDGVHPVDGPDVSALLKEFSEGIGEKRRDAPNDEAAKQRWPYLWFLLWHQTGFDDKIADAARVGFWPKAGVWNWSVNVPWRNTQYTGMSPSITTLLDDVEEALRTHTAKEGVAKKALEEKFQKSRKRS